MAKIPRISIVTPSYNQGKFLEETVKSVLNQEYPNLEYILIDGGSNDNSVEVIQKHQSQLTYWISEPDDGQSHAINKGLSRCTGEIIAWINSDDIYATGTFQFISDYFLKHPEVDMLYGDAEIVDETGNFLIHRKELATDYVMGYLVGWGFLIPQPTAFWRRRVLERVGNINENFKYAMDYEYWQRIAAFFNIKHVSRVLARQRYHINAKTLLNSYTPILKAEVNALRSQGYQRLWIHHIVPFAFSPFIRNAFRLKRIFLRLVYGHYFKGYKPDFLLRKQLSQKAG